MGKQLLLMGGPPEEPHSLEDAGKEVAKTLNHASTHYPKTKQCEVCRRAEGKDDI